MNSSRSIISTDQAPKAIGPYSQGVRTGEALYLSGQIPLDPSTGEIVTGDIAAQTRRVFDNIKAVLEAAGASFGDSFASASTLPISAISLRSTTS